MSDLESLIRSIVRDELARAKPVNDAAPALVTVAEYARARQISESTVRQAISDKRLPVERIGRAVRIPASASIAPRIDVFTARARARLMGAKR